MPEGYPTPIYQEQGGKVLNVTEGGTLSVAAGGAIKRPAKVLTTDYTVPVSENGTHYIVNAADKVMTLPSDALGLTYKFTIGPSGLSTGTGLSISPQAADWVGGCGLTSTANKDLICAGSGDRIGDSVQIEGTGLGGFLIFAIEGTWSKES
jgi:hypothetical protein